MSLRPSPYRLLVPLALLAGLTAPARAALFEPFTPAGPAGARGAAAAAAAFARLDDAAAADLARAGGGRATLPLPGGGAIELALEPLAVLAPDAEITATGAAGPVANAPASRFYRGRVAGDPGAWAVLALAPGRAIGVVSVDGVAHRVAPVAGRPGVVAVAPDDAAPRAWRCAAPDPEPGTLLPPARSAPRAGAQALPPTPTRLVARVAVDCDWEYYSVRFGGDLQAATDYALVLFATASAIYERDLNTTLQVGYLNVWTTSADPYTATDTNGQLPELRDWWRVNRGSVSRHLVHLLSGRSLGGGIAYYQGLCAAETGFAVSQVDGVYTFPTTSTTWDAMVVAHETGHNFGSFHTHSCWWQANGYAPAGTLLDSCYVQESGPCYSGPVYVVPAARGTIMSYCHLAGGMQGIRLDFHPACIMVMREYAERTCIPAAGVQPPRDLIATTRPDGVALEWRASPTPGVLRYDVYRATLPFDPAPDSIGSTGGTAFLDAGSPGGRYTVRAVRASDASPRTGEVQPRPCGVTATGAWPAGSHPVAVVVADFSGDGQPDVAVADSGSAQVAVLRRVQRCTDCLDAWAAPLATALASAPLALEVGDFDEDGVPDLAVGRAGGLTVLRGRTTLGAPDGTFDTVLEWPLPAAVRAVASADFDEDGIPDLALAVGDSVMTCRGLGASGAGDGTFAAPVTAAGAAGARDLAVADLDGDGILDLAVAADGGVRVLRGQGAGGRGDGTFAAPGAAAASAAPVALAVGDFDEDGVPDLVTAEPSAGVRTLRGLGGGAFDAPAVVSAGPGPVDVAVADVDRDGIADLAVANAGDGRVSLLTGTGTGTTGDGGFAARLAWSAGAAPRALAVGDWDHDLRPDLAVTDAAAAGALAVLAFGCTAALSGEVALTAPNGGEWWLAPSEQTVTWSRGAAVGAVDLDESRDGGARWTPLARGLTGTGFTWTATGPYSANARLRVRDARVWSRADTSDAPFTLFPSELLAAPRPEAGVTLSGVRPNPARGALWVTFALPDAAPATLALTDVAGRRVRALAVGTRGAGTHRVELGAGAPLPAGVYLVSLTRAGRTLSHRVVVLE